jgi:hypothetical protein
MEQKLTFMRLTFRQRGHFSNYSTLFPVQELTFAPLELLVTKRGRRIAVPYIQSRACIKETYVAKPYGRVSTWIKQTLISIVAPDGKRYRFDLSAQFADFPERNVILELIKGSFTTEVEKETLSQVKRRMAVAPLVLFVLILIGMFVFWYALRLHGLDMHGRPR